LAAVAVVGLVWPEPHLLQGERVDADQQQHRGWDDQTWQDAASGCAAGTCARSNC